MIRHREVSRIEAFSDAVFGFALTLLVVSLEAPKDLDALMGTMRNFVPFALTFAMVVWIWYEHNVFFRRYGLQDALTVFLNSVLLFVVLFYVYPLRFLTEALINALLFGPKAGEGLNITETDSWPLMVFYSVGVLLVFTSFLLLYWRAWRLRSALNLDAVELLQLVYRARSHSISAGIAVISLLILTVAPNQAMWAGMIYGTMGPLHAWNGFKAGKAQDLLKSLPPPE